MERNGKIFRNLDRVYFGLDLDRVRGMSESSLKIEKGMSESGLKIE